MTEEKKARRVEIPEGLAAKLDELTEEYGAPVSRFAEQAIAEGLPAVRDRWASAFGKAPKPSPNGAPVRQPPVPKS